MLAKQLQMKHNKNWFTITEKCIYTNGKNCFVTIMSSRSSISTRYSFTYLEESCLLVKGASQTIANEAQKQKGGFFACC